MALPLEPYTVVDLTRARSGPTSDSKKERIAGSSGSSRNSSRRA